MSDGERWLRRANLDGQVPIERVIAALRLVEPGAVCILGADGFVAPSHPTLEYILNLCGSSAELDGAVSVRETIAILETWPTGLLVELVVQ